MCSQVSPPEGPTIQCEWMSLPKDKRQTEEQAKPFAKKAMERIPSSGDPLVPIESTRA
jgi:hypothetical protein